MKEKASDKPSYIHIYIARAAYIFPFLLFPRRDILIQLTTEYYLKESTFGESRYIASTQKLSDSILSDIYFCGVLNVAAFYFPSTA